MRPCGCDCCGRRWRFIDIMTDQHFCVDCFRAHLVLTDLAQLARIDAALARDPWSKAALTAV